MSSGRSQDDDGCDTRGDKGNLTWGSNRNGPMMETRDQISHRDIQEVARSKRQDEWQCVWNTTGGSIDHDRTHDPGTCAECVQQERPPPCVPGPKQNREVADLLWNLMGGDGHRRADTEGNR